MKKAILAVSFGTSTPSVDQICLHPIEQALREAFPDREVRRAFTSEVLIHKLHSRGIKIENVENALAQLRLDGYKDILIVPTHIVPGSEYKKVCIAASGYPVSEPLLSCEADILWMVDLIHEIAAEEQQPLLLMGHGADGPGDEFYQKLRSMLPQGTFLACLEGNCRLEEALRQMALLPEKCATLMPLMIVAGLHAQRDLAGDSEQSWKSLLGKQGFNVNIRMQGLGSLPAVQQRFVQKVKSISSQ